MKKLLIFLVVGCLSAHETIRPKNPSVYTKDLKSPSVSGRGEIRTITAYCACVKCCGKHSDGVTASGAIAKQGITIAASRKIPFGTKIYIPGLGWRVVQDRLAKKYDNRIDVYFRSHKEALEFGKKTLKVTIKYKDIKR